MIQTQDRDILLKEIDIETQNNYKNIQQRDLDETLILGNKFVDLKMRIKSYMEKGRLIFQQFISLMDFILPDFIAFMNQKLFSYNDITVKTLTIYFLIALVSVQQLAIGYQDPVIMSKQLRNMFLVTFIFNFRWNLLGYIFSASYDRLNQFHQWTGLITFIMGMVHGQSAGGLRIEANDDSSIGYDILIDRSTRNLRTGWNAFIFFIVIVVSSLAYKTAHSCECLHTWYRWFKVFHVINVFITSVMLQIHNTDFIVLLLSFKVLDQALSQLMYLLMNQYIVHMEIINPDMPGEEFVYLKIKPKYFNLQIRSCAYTQLQCTLWTSAHPFSFCSSEQDKTVDFLIKPSGNDTNLLMENLKNGNKDFVFALDGFQGYLEVNIYQKQDQFLFLSSGIGISPFMSQAATQCLEYIQKVRDFKKLFFYWTVRRQSTFEQLFQKNDKLNLFNELKSVDLKVWCSREDPNFEVDPKYKDFTFCGKRMEVEKVIKDQSMLKGKKALFICGNKAFAETAKQTFHAQSNSDIQLHYENYNFVGF